jgi:uncharacterized protein
MRRVTLVGRKGLRLETEVAEGRRERMRGLLGRAHLPPNGALLIPNARSVHSMGMRFPLDVAFLDAELVVLAVKRLPPGRLMVPRPRARHILECAAGGGPEPGDRLRVREEEDREEGPGFPIYSVLTPGGVRGVPRWPPSSSGLGFHPFKVATRVRIPLGAPN